MLIRQVSKTSKGKYVAPSPIESQFKVDCGLTSNTIIEANNRKFVSALITLDPDASGAWANAHGKPRDVASLSKDADLIAAVQSDINQLNSKLIHWEQVQKFGILDHGLSVKNGELTASLKVKRKVIEERNKATIDAFYS